VIVPAEEAHRLSGDVAAAETFLALAREVVPRDHPAAADLEQVAACLAMALQRAHALLGALRPDGREPEPARGLP
jgi:hypothetical protein